MSKIQFYSIIADEASDSSHKEKMSLILCFVDAKIDCKKEFLAFLYCKWGLSEDLTICGNLIYLLMIVKDKLMIEQDLSSVRAVHVGSQFKCVS